jgi:hypothetical protein
MASGQVLSFRGARGWEVESTIGSIVWLVTGGPVGMRPEPAERAQSPWSRPLLPALLVAARVAI